MTTNQNKMTFLEHFDELRSRILISILAIFIFSVMSYFLSSNIIDFLLKPVRNDIVNFQVLKITSIFFIKIGVSIISGILFSLPFIMFQFFKFISPVFKELSISRIFFFTFTSYSLFIIGLIFGYKVIIPISVSFFSQLSLGINYVALNYTLENYLSYISWILVVSSLVFQLPFILMIVVKLGVVSIKDLILYRRHIIVFFFILGALITPPDPVSQISIVLPLCLLFEFTILFIKFIEKK